MKYREIVEKQGLDNFQKWFGKSKIVDKQGKPLVVYHGTNNTFTAFDPSLTGDIGIHFGDIKQADKASKNAWSGAYYGAANIIPVYLRIENPLYVKDLFSTLGNRWVFRAKHFSLDVRGLHFDDQSRAKLYELAKLLDKKRSGAGGDWSLGLKQGEKAEKTRIDYKALEKEFWKLIETVAKKNGFDGMIYKNKAEGKGLSYVIFDPNQAKSIFNFGTWDDKKSEISENQNEYITIYRGESSHNIKNGGFYSEDKEFAMQFTQSYRDSEIRTRKIKTSDIYIPNPPVYAGDEDAKDNAIKEARSKGFKAVKLSEHKGVDDECSIFVFNKTALKV